MPCLLTFRLQQFICIGLQENSPILCPSCAFCTTQSLGLNYVSYGALANKKSVIVVAVNLIQKPRNTMLKLFIYSTKDICAAYSIGLCTKNKYLCKFYAIEPKPISLRNVLYGSFNMAVKRLQLYDYCYCYTPVLGAYAHYCGYIYHN